MCWVAGTGQHIEGESMVRCSLPSKRAAPCNAMPQAPEWAASRVIDGPQAPHLVPSHDQLADVHVQALHRHLRAAGSAPCTAQRWVGIRVHMCFKPHSAPLPAVQAAAMLEQAMAYSPRWSGSCGLARYRCAARGRLRGDKVEARRAG